MNNFPSISLPQSPFSIPSSSLPFSLSSLSLLPSSPSLSDSLISHLASLSNRLSLKRAFAAAIYLLERSPLSVSLDTFSSLFRAFAGSNTLPPALALFRAMLKNRWFLAFTIRGPVVIQMAEINDAGFRAFFSVFEENCRVALDEKMDIMRPDLEFCNRALDRCCKILGSVSDAKKVLEVMSSLDLSPDLNSFGSLEYLYALTGNEQRIAELHKLLDALRYSNKMCMCGSLILQRLTHSTSLPKIWHLQTLLDRLENRLWPSKLQGIIVHSSSVVSTATETPYMYNEGSNFFKSTV